MIIGYRSNDAVITICQNNSAKSIEIGQVNPMAAELLGYSPEGLAGRALYDFLPSRIADMLREYVEFESDANDVGQVLSKVQSFSVIGRDGKENGYRLKVVRVESTRNDAVFQLVLQDKTGLRRNEALRLAIRENFKGHESLDADSGLPDRHSLNKDIELMGYYSSKGDVRSCFAILQLDHYDDLCAQYGKPVCVSIIRHIAAIARSSLRPDDVVGSVNHKRLGVLLIDTTAESARMVFNRLRWQIAANPFLLPDKSSVGLSVSIGFGRVGGQISEKSLLDECDAALDAGDAQATNALMEVG